MCTLVAGPCTVREVHQVLYHDEGGGYTNALKLLQIMLAKGLVERDQSRRAHVYRAAMSKERTQKRFLRDLAQKMPEGPSSKLVLQALGSQPTTRGEWDEIRALLNKLDKEAS